MNWNTGMDHIYWSKQSEEPLFPDILWSRPESKKAGGKLAIVGGNAHGFGAPGIAYNVSLQAGIGAVRVLLPDAVRKIVAGLLPDADFAESTPSGSFAKQSLGSLLALSEWSDGTLLAGDIGRNSETAILLESFIQKTRKPIAITQDAADYFKETPLLLVDREQTLLVVSLSQLQKIFINTPTITPITLSMTSPQLAEALHNYTLEHPAVIMTKHYDLIFVACRGRVCTTKHTQKTWRVETATRSSVFWLQNINKPFEAISSALTIA